MASENLVVLMGHLGADPETTNVKGALVARFRLATDRTWIDRATGQKQQDVQWHTCVAWGRLAQVVRDYLRKGSPVYIKGRLQTRSWETDKDGVQHACGKLHSATQILLRDLQLFPKKSEDDVPVIDVNGDAAAQEEESLAMDDLPF